LRFIFFSKNHNAPTNSSLIGEKLPNLVTLIATECEQKSFEEEKIILEHYCV
jgi:hypothetical protein